MSYLLRQIAMSLTDDVAEMSAATRVFYQSADVSDRMILNIGNGNYVEETLTIAAGITQALQSDTDVSLVWVDSLAVPRSILVHPGATQDGIIQFMPKDPASFSVTNQTAKAATISYFIFKQPDITTAGAWINTNFTLGFQGSTPP